MARISQDHGIIQYIVDNKSTGVSVDNIAKATGLSTRDVTVLLDYMANQSMIQGISRGTYGPTKCSYISLDPLVKDAVIHL